MKIIYNFKGEVKSDLKQVKPFLDNILYNIKKYILSEELIFEIRLILDELVVNAVMHGNLCNSDKCVFLDVIIYENQILIKVKDEGTGIRYDIRECHCEGLQCCGRGLYLVNALTDGLEFNNNEITVKKSNIVALESN